MGDPGTMKALRKLESSIAVLTQGSEQQHQVLECQSAVSTLW